MKSQKEYIRLKNEIIKEHNRIRTNPKSYIPILEKYIKWFHGNILEKPGADCGIETIEGISAYKEAINFLKTQKPIKEMIFDEEISRASQDHANDIGSTGSTDHRGSDGNTNDDRISRYIEWDITISENIDFGAVSGEEVMVSLLVDDGVDDRAHRSTMFNTKVKYFGVGVAEHKEYEVCTVIDYVGDIISYVDKKKNQAKKVKDNPITPMKVIKALQNAKNEADRKKEIGTKAINNMLMHAKKKEMAKLGKDVKNMKLNEDEDDPFKDDPDAPEGCVSCKTKITKKKIGKKLITTTEKTYTLEDGSEEVVTLEETTTVA